MTSQRSSEPVAHSPSESRPDRWHSLDDHLHAVADLARSFAERFGAGDAATAVGYLHDLGKATDAFQSYIYESWEARRAGQRGPAAGSAPHAIHGALLLRRWLAGPSDASDPDDGLALALTVLHHHGGLRNASDARARLRDAMATADLRAEAAQAATRVERVRPMLADRPPALNAASTLQRELLTRFLVSALVDADRLDAEAFADPERARQRNVARPRLLDLRNAMRRGQEALHQAAPATGMNRVRRELFEAVTKRASEPPGTFRLTVPTGGGKTRTALSFALEHAVEHGLDHVVVAIPFTSIIEQTVDVYRRILGEEAVLEHHASAHAPLADSRDDDVRAMRLPTENWDVPIVVTTTVQLFESLFSNRTSALRKVHRLARSVLVLDEAQTLPTHVLDAIVDALGEITSPRFGASVVLCTATQPSLEVVTGASAFQHVRELAPEPSTTYRELARVSYDVRLERAVPWEEIAAELSSFRQALCIVNTVDDARTLAVETGPTCMHLSTRMCPAHRRAVLEEVRRRLAYDEPCLLVSTQLIEAGVDVDFPVVYRALAPLDAIAQAAGRCNREGRGDEGRVVVFEPENPKVPPGYESGTREARVLLGRGCDLHDPDTFRDYFRTLYGTLVDRDPRGVQGLRREMRFASVEEAFRMIDDDTTSVVVRGYAPENVDRILERVAQAQAYREHLRALQPYLVQVRNRQVPQYRRHGWMMSVGPDEEGPWVWHGQYDERFGIEARSSDEPYVL